jgi:hypothetical protein
MATRETEAGGAGDAGKRRSGGSSSSSSRAGAAGKGGARTAGSSRGATAARQGKAESTVSPGLRKDLREFVQNHPGGWGHNEWIGLVNLLRDRGHDTSDTDRIGLALERERLTLVLERVPGLGARRVQAVADRYPRIWNVMQAGAEELATAANLPKAVAKRIKETLT